MLHSTAIHNVGLQLHVYTACLQNTLRNSNLVLSRFQEKILFLSYIQKPGIKGYWQNYYMILAQSERKQTECHILCVANEPI